MREQLIKEVEIIPVEVVVRNVAAGSIATRFKMEEGTALPRSIVEYYYKSDELGDPTLRACVLGVVRSLVFPAPAEGDYVDVALPIRLLPDVSDQQRPLCDG